MPVTALLPLVLMPPLGVMPAKDLSQNYLKVNITQYKLVRWTYHVDVIFNVVITGHKHAVCWRSDCSCGCRKVESS